MNKNIFDKSYYVSYEDETNEKYIKRQIMYQQEIRRIKRFASSKINKILDYGCGLGNFLDLFENNCQKFGVEVSEYAKQIAINKNIRFDIDKEDENTFDLVVFRGSIAYIENKLEIFTYVSRLLSAEGTIAILSVPNPESLCYRLFNELPLLEKDKQHYLCSISEIIEMLRGLGFHNIKVKKPYWDTPYARRGRDLVYFCLKFLGKEVPPFAFYGNVYEIYAKR